MLLLTDWIHINLQWADATRQKRPVKVTYCNQVGPCSTKKHLLLKNTAVKKKSRNMHASHATALKNQGRLNKNDPNYLHLSVVFAIFFVSMALLCCAVTVLVLVCDTILATTAETGYRGVPLWTAHEPAWRLGPGWIGDKPPGLPTAEHVSCSVAHSCLL